MKSQLCEGWGGSCSRSAGLAFGRFCCRWCFFLQARSCKQSIHRTKERRDTQCTETGEATGRVTAEQLFVRAYNVAQFWQFSEH